MNKKYQDLKDLSKKFKEKFPNSDIVLLEGLPNRKLKVKNKYGVCICDIDTILYYGSTTIKSAKNKTDYFIAMATEQYGDIYDYSLTCYKGSQEKIEIICKKHGSFFQLPSNHLQSQGCKECSKLSFVSKKTKTENNYINLLSNLHDNKYIIKKGTYINTKTKIFHYCNIHKEWFFIRPTNILQGRGCRKCGNLKISLSSKENPKGWSYTNWENSSLKSKFFDSFKVYIIECWSSDEKFYKIGKTYQTLDRRFQSKNEMPYEWKIIKIIKGNAREISELELKLKNMNKKNKYYPNKKFGGDSECFTTLNQNYA